LRKEWQFRRKSCKKATKLPTKGSKNGLAKDLIGLFRNPKCLKAVIGNFVFLQTLEKIKIMEENNQPNEESLNKPEGTPEENQAPEVAAPTAEELLAQEKDKYMRLMADFENFRRQQRNMQIDLIKTATKDLMVELLSVVDDFERAMQTMETASDLNAVKEGVQLIHQRLHRTLEQKGLKEMEAKNTAFDADKHEALTEIPAPSEEQKGQVMDVIQKGYYLNDKIIRFAKVVVGK
jgi:molecular chaperone GrpE